MRPRLGLNSDRRERREAVEAVLEKLRTFPGPVVVEGERDRQALHALGFAGEVVLLSRGRSVLATVEALAQQLGPQGEFAVLTDWDRTGGRLARQLRELGAACDLRVVGRFRRELAHLTAREISCLEQLPSFIGPIDESLLSGRQV